MKQITREGQESNAMGIQVTFKVSQMWVRAFGKWAMQVLYEVVG